MKQYYRHIQTKEVVNELPEPEYNWLCTMWYHLIVEFDTSQDLYNMPGTDWIISHFEAPNKLVFTYNTDWVE